MLDVKGAQRHRPTLGGRAPARALPGLPSRRCTLLRRLQRSSLGVLAPEIAANAVRASVVAPHHHLAAFVQHGKPCPACSVLAWHAACRHPSSLLMHTAAHSWHEPCTVPSAPTSPCSRTPRLLLHRRPRRRWHRRGIPLHLLRAVSHTGGTVSQPVHHLG